MMIAIVVVAGEWTLSLVDRIDGNTETCQDFPGWLLQEPGLNLAFTCYSLARGGVCADGVVDTEALASTGGLFLLTLGDESGQTMLDACCECGGGIDFVPRSDTLFAWTIEVFGTITVVDTPEPSSITDTPTGADTPAPTSATDAPTEADTSEPTDTDTDPPTQADIPEPTNLPSGEETDCASIGKYKTVHSTLCIHTAKLIYFHAFSRGHPLQHGFSLCSL
jgi:hypothetical protein